MPLVDKVILATKPAPPSSIPPLTELSVKMWKSAGWMDARVRGEWSLCWDGVIFLSASAMIV